jgi:hypothetical protein
VISHGESWLLLFYGTRLRYTDGVRLDVEVLGDYASVEEVDDSVCEPCVVGRVRYHDDGGTALIELGEQVHHFQTIGGVEVTGRFVGKDDLGFGHYSPGNGNPLLLTTRKLLWEVVSAVHDVHAFELGLHLFLAVGRGCFQVQQGEFHVFVHGQLVNQVEGLEHKTDVAFAEIGAVALTHFGHFGTKKVILALAGVVEQSEDIEQGRLSATGRAHHRHELAGLDFDAYTIEGGGFHFVGGEKFVQIICLNHDWYGYFVIVVDRVGGLIV